MTSPNFNLQFSYKYELEIGPAKWISIVVAVIITPLLIAAIIYGVYKLHVKGIIHVRIPKPFRIFCFKNYISPEEIEEIRR